MHSLTETRHPSARRRFKSSPLPENQWKMQVACAGRPWRSRMSSASVAACTAWMDTTRPARGCAAQAATMRSKAQSCAARVDAWAREKSSPTSPTNSWAAAWAAAHAAVFSPAGPASMRQGWSPEATRTLGAAAKRSHAAGYSDGASVASSRAIPRCRTAAATSGPFAMWLRWQCMSTRR